MTCMGFGKTCEGILITPAFISERLSSITVYFNGGPITFGPGGGFDTQPYDDIICAVNCGTLLGGLLTLKNDIYENDTDDSTTATQVVVGGVTASFTQMNTANDEQMRRGSVGCKDTKRWIFLRTEIVAPSTTVPTIDFAATWIAGHARSEPTITNYEFDV
jgi:hypothetical protein